MDGQGHSKSWNTNHYILAALGGTLTATIIVIIISLILSPAHITFSVVHASRKVSSNGNQFKLMVTIAANNPSHRCKASYKSIFIDLKNSTSPAGKSFINADVHDTKFPTQYIKGPNVTLINASASLLKTPHTAEAASYTNRLNVSGLTVVVRALVRFKIGATRTRRYEMTVFCPDVLFPEEGLNSSAQQGNLSCRG